MDAEAALPALFEKVRKVSDTLRKASSSHGISASSNSFTSSDSVPGAKSRSSSRARNSRWIWSMKGTLTIV